MGERNRSPFSSIFLARGELTLRLVARIHGVILQVSLKAPSGRANYNGVRQRVLCALPSYSLDPATALRK